MTPSLGPAGKVAHFFIDSKLTPLLILASLLLGAFAVLLTPREEEPQITVPMVDIFVGLPGSAPQEVESRVTVPLEKRMWEIPGVEYVYAASMPSVAMVSVRFLVGQDQERSLVKVYDKLASGLDRMPPGATPPLVRTRAIDDVPVLGLTLWSARPDQDGFALRRLAAELGKELSRLDDVSEIKLIGGQHRQLRVQLDAGRMAAMNADPGTIVQALQFQNASAPAGAIEQGNREIKLETGAFLRSREEVERLVVGAHQGKPVYLRDVATVLDGPEEPADYVAFFPGPAAATRGIDAPAGLYDAVTIAVAKRKGADAYRVTAAALDKLNALKGTLVPSGVEIAVTRNYGDTAREKVDELELHLLFTIVIVTIFIALALGWRGSLVVFISLPVTFALTLFVYYVFGYTLNRVTLFALIFVTGLVVDDSIIVVENVARHFSMKKLPPLEAAVAAVSEVGNPTILATFTVIAALLPMAFVRGLMGPYMAPMPIGASLAMLFSLVVALTIAPWLAYRLLRGGHAHDEDYDVTKTKIYGLYRRMLVPMMERPLLRWAFLAGVAVLLLAAVAMFPLKMVAVKMLPFDNKSELQVVVDMPEGTTLEETARVAREIGISLGSVPEVTDIELYAGTSAPVNFNGLVRHYDLRRGANVADLQVNLAPKHARDDQSHDIAKRIRPQVEEIARRNGAAVKILEVPPGPPVLSTLVAEVYGPDAAARQATAERIKAIFEATPDVVDVDWWVEAPQPKDVFEVDREKAALHGVPAAQVARALRALVAGEDVGLLHRDTELEPVAIRVELPRAERSSAAALSAVKLAAMSGAMVPMSELVTVRCTVEPPSLHRKNLKPVVYVTAEVSGREESPVYAILKMADQIGKLEVPGGGFVRQYYRDEPNSEEKPAMKWDGEWHITYEVFRDLGFAFAAVLVLIYLLIIGWFRSFTVPLIMMVAIPLGLIGVIPGHWALGAFFTATSMIGFIALAGIMVRNGILLIDFVELALAEGRTLGEALVEAGAVRTRPIVLTAGAVVMGAVVILFDPIFQGLAIALMFGSLASTVLTLVVVPVLYYMAERHKYKRPLPASWDDEPADAVEP
jgi:multidrug efflux pump subunit AcrB